MSLSLVLIGSVLGVVALGVFLWGSEAGRGRAKVEALQVEQALKAEILKKTKMIVALGQREAALNAQVDRLTAVQEKAREEAQQRRLRAIENDVTRHDNQMQNVEGCALRSVRPVTRRR